MTTTAIFARMPADPPAPGLYPNVGFADYCRWRAWNQSTLKQFGEYDSTTGQIEPAPWKSPAHALAYLTDGEAPTEDQAFGTGYHTLLFEPHRFVREFHVLKHPIDKRTKAGKEEWAALSAQFGADRLIDVETWNLWRGMADAAARDAHAKPMLGAIGEREVSGVFADAETGAVCKFRIDKLIRVPGRQPIIVDLKTTKCAHWRRFEWDAGDYGYHVQAAMYTDAVESLTGERPIYYVVAQEKEPPFAAVVYRMREEELDSGRRIYRAQLRLAEKCVKTNIWPGYADGRVVELVLHERFHAEEPASIA